MTGKEPEVRSPVLTEISDGDALGKQRQTRSVQPRGLRFVVITKRGTPAFPVLSLLPKSSAANAPLEANSTGSPLLSGPLFGRASAGVTIKSGKNKERATGKESGVVRI